MKAISLMHSTLCIFNKIHENKMLVLIVQVDFHRQQYERELAFF